MDLDQLPYVSVVVPALPGPHLQSCVTALLDQDYPCDLFEIIIVDNSPDNSLRALTASFPRVHLLHCGTPGSYAARNCGIRGAQGQIIAFTDSDCVPANNWVSQGVAQMQSEGLQLLAGEVTMLVSERPSAIEVYEQRTALKQSDVVRLRQYGVTANLLVRSALFDRIGLFDEHLVSGGDMEWGWRALRMGIKVVYCPQAVVFHYARRTPMELRRRTMRILSGLAELRGRRDMPIPPSTVTNAARLHIANLTAHLPVLWRSSPRSAICFGLVWLMVSGMCVEQAVVAQLRRRRPEAKDPA